MPEPDWGHGISCRVTHLNKCELTNHAIAVAAAALNVARGDVLCIWQTTRRSSKSSDFLFKFYFFISIVFKVYYVLCSAYVLGYLLSHLMLLHKFRFAWQTVYLPSLRLVIILQFYGEWQKCYQVAYAFFSNTLYIHTNMKTLLLYGIHLQTEADYLSFVSCVCCRPTVFVYLTWIKTFIAWSSLRCHLLASLNRLYITT